MSGKDPYRCCCCGAELDHPLAVCDRCGPSGPDRDDAAADRAIDEMARASELTDRERAHFQAVERAWETGRAELALLRGRPEHAGREAMLRSGLRSIEDYLTTRWVMP